MNFRSVIACGVMMLAACAFKSQAQQMPPLPVDEAVRIGKLDNGLTYYIRHNEEPQNMAHFYIVQRVGAVQEEESQRGLAHFLEHMCFNGTKNFPGNNIVRYCESIGVRFGAELNAATYSDRTVYNINNVPTTIESNIDSVLLILHDWSNDLLLEDEEIDKERGVIHEEWRMRSSAQNRILERNLPALYPGSVYGERFPIGLMSVIDNFKYEELRNYYEKWYRPDLQAIIVVGDVDVDAIEKKIQATFAPVEMPANAAPFAFTEIPSNPEAIYVTDHDPEMQGSMWIVNFKQDKLPAELGQTMMKQAMEMMQEVPSMAINQRLSELTQSADCPFLMAQFGYGDYLLSAVMGAMQAYIVAKPGQELAALQTVMTEVERVRRFGLTETELQRASQEFLSQAEQTFTNREKLNTGVYVNSYIDNFLWGAGIPSVEVEYQVYQQLAQMLPAAQLNMYIQQSVGSIDQDFVVVGLFPDNVECPTADQAKAAVAAARNAELEAYVDEVNDEPLVAKLPKAGKIKKQTAAPMDFTCWELSNGARVYFRQTDFDDSEVLFTALSNGGRDALSDAQIPVAKMMSDIVGSTGTGNFTYNQFNKAMMGKQAMVRPMLDQIYDMLEGRSVPKDLRTLFELIYLRFQPVVDDPDGYQTAVTSKRNSLEMAKLNPLGSFSDSIAATLYDHNPRYTMLNLDELDKVTYADYKKLMSERFQSAGDFDFFFVGAFDVDSLRAFTEQYIASLPGLKKREKSAVASLKMHAGTTENRYSVAMQTPQAYTVQVFHADNTASLHDGLALNVLGNVLSQRYLKSIREDRGYAYSVGTNDMVNRLGEGKTSLLLQTICPFTPEKVDSVLYLFDVDIQAIAADGITDAELETVRTQKLKSHQDAVRQNNYWMSAITTLLYDKDDVVTGYVEILNALTTQDVQDILVKKILPAGNRITVTILPE